MRRPYLRIQFQLTLSVFVFTAICLATLAAVIYKLSENTLLKLERDNLDLECQMRNNEIAHTIVDMDTVTTMLAMSREVETLVTDSQANFKQEASALSMSFDLNGVVFMDIYNKSVYPQYPLVSKSLNSSVDISSILPLRSENNTVIEEYLSYLNQTNNTFYGPAQFPNALVPGYSYKNELLSVSSSITDKGLTSLSEQGAQRSIYGYLTVVYSAQRILEVLENNESNDDKSHIEPGVLCVRQTGSADTLRGLYPSVNVTIGRKQAQNVSDNSSYFQAEIVNTPGLGKVLVSITRLSPDLDYFVALRQLPKGYDSMPNSLRDIILETIFSVAGGMLLFSLLGASYGSRQVLRLKMATMYEKPNSRRWLIPWWLQATPAEKAASIESEGRIPENVPLRAHLRDELDDIAQRFNEMSNSLAAQYATLEERVEEREGEIDRARKAANDANDAKSHFLARITHELRTPLNGILGTATLCLEDDNVEQIHQSLKTIFKCGELLLHLMTDLLSFSENEVENIVLDMREFTISDIESQLTAIFTEQCSSKDIQLLLEIQSEARGFVLHGDTNRILQIVFNLISNGLKFTPPGGKLYFRVKMVPGESDIRTFIFEVEDTGPGVAPHLQHKIFEEFVQGDIETSTRRAGVGLGLYICRHLAERMGGSIRLTSELGKGSLFTFEVPVRVTSIGEDVIKDQEIDLYPDCDLYSPSSPSECKKIDFGTVTSKSPSADRPAFSRSKSYLDRPPSNLKALVVDDNKVNQEVMKRMLNLEGIQSIEVASDGIEAVNKVRESQDSGAPFDVVFMDVQMPNMDGREAARRIRNDINYQGSIVAVSAFANEENANGCIEAGMNLFLTKPLRRPHLCQILRGLSESEQ